MTATARLPSVPFLMPTGMDRPLAISRWVWDSVVRAPIALQEMRSAMYCGVIGSSASVAQGRPSSFRSSRSLRAMRRPFVYMKGVVEVGVVDEPFQPTVVRGFSK